LEDKTLADWYDQMFYFVRAEMGVLHQHAAPDAGHRGGRGLGTDHL